MARLIWSPQALASLEEMLEYIARSSPRAAADLGAAILDAVERLAMFPRSGRIVPGQSDRSYREVIVQSYRVLYHISEDSEDVELLDIRHGARRPPDLR